jgi:acyl-CoA thioesterase FadM/ketosteroid isomerase-like protein
VLSLTAPTTSPRWVNVIDLSDARKLLLTVEAVVEPHLLDGMGHMNVAGYMQLFDRGIWEFFEQRGIDAEYRRVNVRGMFGLEDNLRYLSELREGDALQVYTGVTQVRPKTLRLLEYMLDPVRQKVAAVREVVAAHIDLATRKTTPFPAELLAQLEAGVVPAPAMTDVWAQAFARSWTDAWNRRDVEAVLAHYADDAVFVSPTAARVVGNPVVEGKAALRAYWQAALEQIESLKFTLEEALWSARTGTLTVVYQSQLGSQAPTRAVEIMSFRAGRVVRGEALYGAVAPAP